MSIVNSKQRSSSPPKAYLTLQKNLLLKIKKEGFSQSDRRLDRWTRTISGDFVVVKDKKTLDWLKSQTPLRKYGQDWTRMMDSFNATIRLAKKDVDSRRLMVFNDHRFHSVYQCFTSFQFINTKRFEFDLYVYQRSADMAKFTDDMIFFANAARVFEKYVKVPVTKIVVVYGSLHYEIPNK